MASPEKQTRSVLTINCETNETGAAGGTDSHGTDATRRRSPVSDGSMDQVPQYVATEQSCGSDDLDGDYNLTHLPVPEKQQTLGIDTLLERIPRDLDDMDEASTHLTALEAIICGKQHPPIDKLVQSNITPTLVTLLALTSCQKLKFTAARLLTEIASGTAEQAGHVVEAGACPIFIDLLRSDDRDMVELMVWTLAKIALLSRDTVELLIEHDILSTLSSLVCSNTHSWNESLMRNLCRCLCNLLHDYPKPLSADMMTLCLPTVKHFLSYNSHLVQLYACQALSGFVDTLDEKQLDEFVELGILDRVVMIVQTSTQGDMIRSALAILECISELHAQLIIDRGIIPLFKELLTNDRLQTDDEVVIAVLHNIAARSEPWIQAVVDAGLVPLLIKLLQSNSVDVQEEAVNAVAEITTGGNREHIAVFFRLGVLRPLIDILGQENTAFVTRAALTALENIVRTMRVTTCVRLWQNLRRLDLLYHLEELSYHEDADIRNLVNTLESEYRATENCHDEVLG